VRFQLTHRYPANDQDLLDDRSEIPNLEDRVQPATRGLQVSASAKLAPRGDEPAGTLLPDLGFSV
jgi:hypothetical protein